MAKINIWDILHKLTNHEVVEVESDNLDADYTSVYKRLRTRNLTDKVAIGKDKDKSRLVLVKKSTR